MKLIIAGEKSRFVHLKDFGDALTRLNVEYRLVHDVDFINRTLDINFIGRIQTPIRFKKLIEEYKPDAVLLDRPTELGLLVLKMKIPFFVLIRGDIWAEVKLVRETLHRSPIRCIALWRRQKIQDRCFRGAKSILPISNYLEKIVRTHYPNKSIIVLPADGRNPSEWFHVDNMELKHPCVGLLQGATIWGKVEEMFTLPKVLEAMPHVTFYWAGDGHYKNLIFEKLQKYNNFKWLGSLQYPDVVRKYLSGIDVYALFSGMDALGQTIIEAQLMEKPVIATRAGGIPEVIEDDKTGFLVEKGDYKRWIEKISFLINDNKKARQIASAGRKFAVENFSWDRIAEKFIVILNMHLKNS